MKTAEFSNQILHQKTLAAVQSERDITLSVLRLLRENERRSLFAEMGYSSLFEYALKELKYNESSAQRRIASMRLLKELPEIEKKIEEGSLTLTSIAKAQSFFRQEEIKGAAAKKEMLLSLEGKSTREVERELLAKSSQPERFVREKVKATSATHSELKVVIEDKLLEELEELKNLLAHSHPGAPVKDLLQHSVKVALSAARLKTAVRAKAAETSDTAKIERKETPLSAQQVKHDAGNSNPAKHYIPA